MIETITIDTEQWAVVPRTLLEEIAESLACELDARYPACNRSYPSQERKYLAEMEPVIKAREILAAAPRPEVGQHKYQRPVCRGSWALGSACGKCERCEETRPQQPAPRPVPTCDWQEDSDGIWETSCGEAWVCTEGTPAENNMKFCHSCGKHLKEHLYTEPDGGAV